MHEYVELDERPIGLDREASPDCWAYCTCGRWTTEINFRDARPVAAMAYRFISEHLSEVEAAHEASVQFQRLPNSFPITIHPPEEDGP